MPAFGLFRGTLSAPRTSAASSPAFPTPRSTAPRIPTAARRTTANRSAPTSRPSPRTRGWSAPIRRPAAPSWSRRSPTSSACASRSAPGSTRTPNATSAKCARSSISPRKHRNIDSIVVGNETIYRGEQTVDELITQDSARQARDLGSGHHRRNLERLDRASGAGLGGRLHRRAHSALLGRHLRKPARSIRRSASTTSCAQAYPGKRIVIAEFGWPSAGYNRRDANPGR